MLDHPQLLISLLLCIWKNVFLTKPVLTYLNFIVAKICGKHLAYAEI